MIVVEIEGTDALLGEARRTAQKIVGAVPGETLRLAALCFSRGARHVASDLERALE
jgi:hypothetical protein